MGELEVGMLIPAQLGVPCEAITIRSHPNKTVTAGHES